MNSNAANRSAKDAFTPVVEYRLAGISLKVYFPFPWEEEAWVSVADHKGVGKKAHQPTPQVGFMLFGVQYL